MNELRILGMVNEFPIGDEPKTRLELLSKAEVVSYLSRFQEQFSSIQDVNEREEVVKQFLGDVIRLESDEFIPNLDTAERVLNLTPGFVKDYNSIQMIKEINPSFDETYNLISKSVDLSNKSFKSI